MIQSWKDPECRVLWLQQKDDEGRVVGTLELSYDDAQQTLSQVGDWCGEIHNQARLNQ